MKYIDEGKEICTFLEKKLAYFKQYLTITEKMKEAFEHKEESKTLSCLISKRQACINKIDRIDLSIEKTMKTCLTQLSRISNKYRRLIDNYLSNIRDIMAKVDLMDRALVVVAKQEGESIQTELLKMRNMRQAASGYRMDTKYPPRFLDTRR